jgi:hypothetical protein
MEEYSLRVSGNRRLRKLFGPKTNEAYDISFMTCTSHQYHSGDTMKKNEMDGSGDKFEREESYIMEFSGKTQGKEIYWKS